MIELVTLSKREINVLICGALFVLVFLVSQFMVIPMLEKQENLERILTEKQNALEEMLLEHQHYLSLSNRLNIKKQGLAHRGKGFSLFSFLDSQAEKSNVKENVTYMTPVTKPFENTSYKIAAVKVKLNGVYLKDLIDFLYQIESSENAITITSLSLSKAGQEKIRLDALIEAETLMPEDGV